MLPVGIQLSVLGLYLPPVFWSPLPPQTIISLPVQTAVCSIRPSGGPGKAVQVSSMQLSAISDILGSE